MIIYFVVFFVLLLLELCYFKVADYYNIIDKPNERSSHSTIVLRGGGVLFTIAVLIWILWQMVQGDYALLQDYWLFVVGLVFIAGVSFVDDIHSLPRSVRLIAQFVAMALMFWCLGIMYWHLWWLVIIGLVVFVGATNIIDFMDGINGITAGYALAVLLPLLLMNHKYNFIDEDLLVFVILGVLVFCIFNFRPQGKVKCFAGDVGSIGIAFIMLFAIGKLILSTNDITWLIFLIVYGVDGCLTIVHRMMLHEHLGQAHRKHAYQLMANELGMSHVVVSLIYMGLQLAISLGFIYLCPNTVLAHWIYSMVVGIVLAIAYIVFMKKYYHLHEDYLCTIRQD